MSPQDQDRRARAERETLEIPDAVRRIIDERDGFYCRVCGKYQGQARAIHHTIFGGDARGLGGRRRHDPAEMVTICWMWPGNCHDRVHSEDKKVWQQLLLSVVEKPGMTALQMRRWMDRRPDRYHPWTVEEAETVFWSRVKKGPDCWLWTGFRDANGYGQFRAAVLDPTRPLKSHRVSFFFSHGRWPEPAALHHCDVAACVRPDHLYEGDQVQNMEDRKVRRPRWGAANPAARHSHLVDEIRARHAAGESQASIVRVLNVSQPSVSRIVRGINYPHKEQDERA